MFFEIYASINEERSRKSNIVNENRVCLNISNLIFSLLLSFIIELCSLIPLTASAIMQGMNKTCCNKTVENKNKIPFPSS